MSPLFARRRRAASASRTCLVVRHADALNRSGWRGDDALRPLSEKGKRQAFEIASKLSSSNIGRMISSPAVRCVATLAPLADSLGLDVEPVDFLFEGSDPADALRRLVEMTSEQPPESTLVACSHGDVFTGTLSELGRAGVIEAPAPTVQKGGALDLTLAGSSVTGVEVLAPFG